MKKKKCAERACLGAGLLRAEHIGGDAYTRYIQPRQGALEVAHEKGTGLALRIKVMSRKVLGVPNLEFPHSALGDIDGIPDGEQLRNVFVGNEKRHRSRAERE